jgi:outer membrane protein assembly factor BamB
VLVDGKLFGCWLKMYCLDVEDGLKPLWTAKDDVFEDYVCMFGSRERIMVIGVEGELLLIDTSDGRYNLISRMQTLAPNNEVLSHPALVGNRLYIRDSCSIRCIVLYEE